MHIDTVVMGGATPGGGAAGLLLEQERAVHGATTVKKAGRERGWE